MKYNARKVKMISKIIDEITSFYLENGAEDLQIKVVKDAKSNEYSVYTYGVTDLSDEEVNEIKKSMTIHHDLEYSEYWELMGEGESTDELILVARICDSVYINYEEGILEFILKKKI